MFFRQWRIFQPRLSQSSTPSASAPEIPKLKTPASMDQLKEYIRASSFRLPDVQDFRATSIEKQERHVRKWASNELSGHKIVGHQRDIGMYKVVAEEFLRTGRRPSHR